MRIFLCGGVNKNMKKEYLEGIRELGEAMLKRGHSIICTGATTGAIGEVFNVYDKNNGLVKILIAECYHKEAEAISSKHPSIIVKDLYTLQEIAITNSDVIVVLPGGNGTLAELHMLTDNIKAGYHKNKVIIYNINGYYDSVLKTLEFAMEQGTMEKSQFNEFNFVTNVDDAIAMIDKFAKKVTY